MNNVLFIVGPTASGKSALALEAARSINGEIVCADSRTVYKGLDVGTAKPTAAERRAVPHHLLDVAAPDENFTVADFKRMAEAAISDIRARGKVPIVVGGSGLYVDAVLFDYRFAGTNAARDPLNPRHVSPDVPQERSAIRPDAAVIGLTVDRDVLKQRIEARVESMVQAGFSDEVKRVQRDYPDSKALHAPGYKAFSEYINGERTLDEAKVLFVRNDAQLAKRQMTWFRRNPHIRWFESADAALESIKKLYTAD